MKVKKARTGIGFYLGTLVLLAAIVLALFPSVYGRAQYGLGNTLRDYPSKLLDLSESSFPGTVQLLTNFLSASLDGRFPADLEELRLDIKFEDLQEIQEDRKSAMEVGVLREPMTVSARIEHGYKTYRARVRLKGRVGDHWMGPDRWSLRVRLRGGATIGGFNQFSLQRPRVRQLPYDQLFQYWGKAVGVLTPDFNFFRLYVNGDYWGIALAEEHVSKQFLERNQRKESALLKLGNVDYWYYQIVNRGVPERPEAYYGKADINLYGERNYRDDLRVRSLFSYAGQAYRKLLRNEVDLSEVIDISAFTKSFLLAIAWNHQHPLHDSNARYYVNPYTLLVEPITTDQTIYTPLNREDPVSNPPFADAGTHLPFLYQRLIEDEEFYDYYGPILSDMERTLASLTDEHVRVCTPFPLDCPRYREEVLRENLDWLREDGSGFIQDLGRGMAARRASQSANPGVINPTSPRTDIDYPEHVYAEYRESGILRVYNLLSHEVEVTDIWVLCDKAAGGGNGRRCEAGPVLGAPVKLASGTAGGLPRFKDFDIQAGHVNGSKSLRITSALGDEVKHILVRLTLVEDLMNPLVDLPQVGAGGRTPEFLRLEGGQAYVKPGIWKVVEPLILPRGMGLVLAPGTTLRFSSDAYLLLRGSLSAEGEADAPIVLKAADSSWKGIYVLQAEQRSRLRHVIFENTNFLEDGVLQLTGAVNFYRSDVQMDSVTFKGSQAEDALNIIESGFEIRDSVFLNTRSDAFDADFSEGVIAKTRFESIGGDGLDTSGSDVQGDGLVFDGVYDKAISAGEGSNISLGEVIARHVAAAAVSKDGSDLKIESLVVSDVKIATGMAYRKKSIYGAARLRVVSSNGKKASFHNQVGNELVVRDYRVPPVELDVDALYREGPMKKIEREEAMLQ